MIESCKVVACYFGERRKIEDRNKLIQLYSCLLNYELSVNPGSDYDLILVCPDVKAADKVSNYLFTLFETLSDTYITNNRKLILLRRKNIGGSFGSFDYAFNLFQDRYQYWLFTEDDQIFVINNYFKHLITCINRYNDVGYVGNLGLFNCGGEVKVHIGGGIGLSTREKLLKLKNHFGKLPHSEKDLNLDGVNIYDEMIYQGEVMFTSSFSEIGLKLMRADHRSSVSFLEHCDLLNHNVCFDTILFPDNCLIDSLY